MCLGAACLLTSDLCTFVSPVHVRTYTGRQKMFAPIVQFHQRPYIHLHSHLHLHLKVHSKQLCRTNARKRWPENFVQTTYQTMRSKREGKDPSRMGGVGMRTVKVAATVLFAASKECSFTTGFCTLVWILWEMLWFVDSIQANLGESGEA